MGVTALRKRLTTLLRKAVRDRAFPSAVAGVAHGPPGRRQNMILTHGWHHYGQDSLPVDKTYFYDLASLTKPFATLLAILCLKKSGAVGLETTLPDLLGRPLDGPKADIRLRHLLGHSSGLPAHQPYFKALMALPEAERQDAVLEMILQEPLQGRPGERVVYSDLGYILLGRIIEHLSGSSLQEYVDQQVLMPLGLEGRIFFNPGNTPRRVRYAPTEECAWRKRFLRGQVHDDNCFAMGGVAGHAGLFGAIEGVLALACHLLDVRLGRDCHPNYRPQDLVRLVVRQHLPEETTWALGVDTPSALGSSGGRYLSARSFGHLGFTGTSVWIDPEKELAMVLLTNRVCPSRENIKIKAFRPRFHDLVVEEMILGK